MFRTAFMSLSETNKETLIAQISQTLFIMDPLGTCCKENNAEDEYDYLAISFYFKINDYLMDDKISYTEMITSLNDCIEEYFGEYLNRVQVKQIYDNIMCNVCYLYGYYQGTK